MGTTGLAWLISGALVIRWSIGCTYNETVHSSQEAMTSKLNVGRGSSRNIQKELKNMKILTKIKKLISKKNLTSVSVSKNTNNHTTKTTQ